MVLSAEAGFAAEIEREGGEVDEHSGRVAEEQRRAALRAVPEGGGAAAQHGRPGTRVPGAAEEEADCAGCLLISGEHEAVREPGPRETDQDADAPVLEPAGARGADLPQAADRAAGTAEGQPVPRVHYPQDRRNPPFHPNCQTDNQIEALQKRKHKVQELKVFEI